MLNKTQNPILKVPKIEVNSTETKMKNEFGLVINYPAPPPKRKTVIIEEPHDHTAPPFHAKPDI